MYKKDIVIIGWRDDAVRWTAHHVARHLPTGLTIEWVASWNDLGLPRDAALAKLEELVREELARREPKS